MRFISPAARRIVCASVAAVAVAAVPAIASAAPVARPAGGPGAAAPAAAVPKGFRAASITWISPARGWVLGAELCGKLTNCKGSQVIGTTDGGRSWHLVGRLAAPIPKLGIEGPGVTDIRFATAHVGWAFGRDLYRTANGGRTWVKVPVPGGGKQVLSLAVTRAAGYTITSPCPYLHFVGCKGPLTAWRTGTAGGPWTRMRFPRPLHINVAANVAAFGSTVYVINPPVQRRPAQFFASTDGGRHFSVRHNPCPAITLHTLIQAAPYSASKVALFCDGNPGFSKAVKSVYLSRDTARKDSYAGTMNRWGIDAQLAASPSGNLAVEAWSNGSFIDINVTKGGTTWHQVIASGDYGAGFNDITYVTGKVAWVVYAPVSMYAAAGVLYKTTNAGRTWRLARF